jgi:glycosyltransferase involved in cell wall biosynthesis
MDAAPLRRLLMLAPAGVGHAQRWATALAGRGVEVVLATQHPDAAWAPPAGVRVVALPHRGTAGYFRNVPALRRLLRAERPELLHAHYASGYGTTAALAGWHPWLLSVWGSDVYEFPFSGALQGWWLRRNLRRADAIASTSRAMAGQVRRLTPDRGAIAVTPFGIDTARFAPAQPGPGGGEAGGSLAIGTVKTLAPAYGIDRLLRAFARLAAPAGGPLPTLLIVGGGPQEAELRALAQSLGIATRVRWVGPVPHAEVPAWLNRLDVFVAPSRIESFGVAVLEASACARPVVVSDAGGLPEVVVDGETGLVVPGGGEAALAGALERLAGDAALRRRLGEAGRRHVQRRYEWSACVGHMLACLQAARDGRPPPAPGA